MKKFEDLFAEFIDVKHGVATTSCTTALHLGLLFLGVGPGDEVIIPSFTFIATANAVEYCQAKPVFCDVDLRTFNLDINKYRKYVSSTLKAAGPPSVWRAQSLKLSFLSVFLD